MARSDAAYKRTAGGGNVINMKRYNDCKRQLILAIHKFRYLSVPTPPKMAHLLPYPSIALVGSPVSSGCQHGHPGPTKMPHQTQTGAVHGSLRGNRAVEVGVVIAPVGESVSSGSIRNLDNTTKSHLAARKT